MLLMTVETAYGVFFLPFDPPKLFSLVKRMEFRRRRGVSASVASEHKVTAEITVEIEGDCAIRKLNAEEKKLRNLKL